MGLAPQWREIWERIDDAMEVHIKMRQEDWWSEFSGTMPYHGGFWLCSHFSESNAILQMRKINWEKMKPFFFEFLKTMIDLLCFWKKKGFIFAWVMVNSSKNWGLRFSRLEGNNFWVMVTGVGGRSKSESMVGWGLKIELHKHLGLSIIWFMKLVSQN